MTDVLDAPQTDAPVPPGAAGLRPPEPGFAPPRPQGLPAPDVLPPPPTTATATTGGRRRLRRPRRRDYVTGLAVLAVVGGALMTAMWSSAVDQRNVAVEQRDIAISERDAAITERNAASGALQERAVELNAAQVEIDTAAAEIERLRTEAAAAADTVRALELAAAEADSTNEALARETDELIARIGLLEAELAAVAASPAGTVFVAADHPDFSRYLGEVLSSRLGPSPLTAAQNQCFGGVVGEALGLDGVGASLRDAATADALVALDDAMRWSAALCSIDPALIFG